jgi:membrane-bound serine protease (ClpP class)
MSPRVRIALWLGLALVGTLAMTAGSAGQSGGIAYQIELDGTIDPASERWIDQALSDAEEQDAALALITIDTPGGLDDSTREIVQRIIAAEMPVVMYVSPDGARAASAGVFITQAADVAAMAPQTNIGSATPVSIGPGGADEVLGRKVTNDAAAYARALAEGHGRNGELAAETVTDARNLTATEALDEELIDAVAPTEDALLAELDGFEIKGPKAGTLDTTGLAIEPHDMPLHLELLQILVNPNVSFLLLLLGLAGIAFELLSPGLVLPGGIGAVSLLLGLFGTAMLPFTLAGILLLVAAVVLIVAEAHLPTGGAVGAVGVAALVASGLLLYNTDSEALDVSLPVIIAVGVVVGALGLFMAERVYRAQKQDRVLTGWEEMIGAVGEVRVPLDPVGQVFVEGALWRAVVEDGDKRVPVGSRVRVRDVEGLSLHVEPLPVEQGSPAHGPRELDLRSGVKPR